MREIKFRVRDNNTKKIVGYEVVINGVWNREYTGESHKISKWNEGSFSKQYIREQFTGLQDKNGKDIYEGDIYHQGDKNILYKVIFKDCSFIGNQIGNDSLAGLSHFIKDIEVIGNIYENPELLTN